jgi:TonB-linked SusC/RagA family outer membrane protein
MQTKAIGYPMTIHRGLLLKTFHLMRTTAIILLAGFLQVSAKGLAQEKISISEKDVKIQKVFEDIQKQTSYTLWYKTEILEKTGPVTIEVKDASLEETLNLCVKDQPLDYHIVGNNVVIEAKVSNHISGLTDLKGKVVNENGEPLAGAAVQVKGTTKGTQTDDRGLFELKGIDDHEELIISYTGYEPQTILVNGKTFFMISLSVSKNPLDEVQVIAYGTVSKRLNTGDVSTVKAESIEEQPVSNPLAALEGQVPGLLVTQQTGVPGGNFTVQIRGQNSIASGNNPLYIIDGVPFTASSLTQIQAANMSSSPLNSINPSDIASIEILKDADATAIYGSRGANGVILITTKKGKAGKTLVDVNGHTGVGKVTRTVKYLNLEQYLAMRHEAFENDHSTPQSYDYDVNGTWDTTRYTDWQKLLIGGSSQTTDAQVSVSGGNINTQFVFGGGYHKEITVFPGNFPYQKGSGHFNLTNTSDDKKFKANFSALYVVDNNSLPYIDLTGSSSLPPDTPPIYDSTGKLNWSNGTFTNPFSYLIKTYREITNNLIANTILSYQILADLQIRASLGYTRMQMDEQQLNPINSINPTYNVQSGNSYFANNSISTWIIEPQLSYQKKLGNNRLDLLVGTTFQENIQKSISQTASGFSSDALLANIAAATNVSSSTGYTQYKYNAAFGRLNFNNQDKFLINLTARRDGSSRFGPGKQFANFGAIGAAWIFSKEDFVQNILPFLSFGKFRSSYGITGNDQIGDYQYLSTYFPTGISYQGNVGLTPTRLSNPDFAWEINKKIEFGLELGVLRDRFLISLSYYRNRSGNQLVGYPLPLITGFSSIQGNFPALVQNTGLELEINTTNVRSKEFTWTSTLNISVPHNKLVSFPDIENTNYRYTYTVGQSLSLFKGYQFFGVDPASGVYQFIAKNGKPTSSPNFPDDYIYSKNLEIIYYGGLKNSFKYKGFQLDVLFQFVNQPGKAYLYGYLPGVSGNQPTSVLNRWQKPGDVTNIERFNSDFTLYNSWSNAYYSSDQLYKDASFVRLKNLSLSWELPEKCRIHSHIQNGRIYIQIQNLLTLTRYQGLDPENQSNQLPPLRVITVGIQVTI